MAVMNRRRSAAAIAGLTLHLRHDSDAIAARARRGLELKFEREIREAFPELSGTAFHKKVQLARKLYFARLAKASADARRARRKSPDNN